MAASFVTNYGHPENNGLSFASPKRTINQGAAAGTPTYLKGFFNENVSAGGNLIGVDGAVYDANPNFFLGSGGYTYSNMYIISQASGIGAVNCNYGNDNTLLGLAGVGVYSSYIQFYRNLLSTTNFGTNATTAVGQFCTFLGVGLTATMNIYISTSIDPYYNIISNFIGGITFPPTSIDAKKVRYSLFSKSKFKFTMTGGASNETTFTYPTGATDQLKLDNLKTRMATVYGGAPDDYLVGCKYTDDANTTIFIDPARNNYYLVPNSLPTKMSYDGKYIGARPEGSFVAFNSSNFTYTNFDANGNIVDQRVDATATSSIVDMLQIRTINKLDSLGQLAARNGNELNLTETILPAPLIYTNSLTLGRTYKVYNASITVGATTYAIGDCFIAKGTSFISGADTYNPTGIAAGTLLVDLGCYEVENNSVTYMGVTYTTGQRFQCYYDSSSTFTGTGTVKRFMGGFVRLLSEYYGTTGITAGTTLRYMQTYEVVGGTSVTYNSVVYTPGQRFTALASPTTFTQAGGATISEWNIGYPKSLEMKASKSDSALSTDVWIKMHLTDAPLVNVDGNGKITHGNLDSGFNRAAAIPMSVRYWQCRLTVQSLNIPY